VEGLFKKIKKADPHNCTTANNEAIVTIVDYRVQNFLKTKKPVASIKTNCPLIKCLLDDLRNPAVRNKIPRQGLVVLISETGNRDTVAMKYLHKYSYTNIVGLRTGMRGWLKLNYPVEYSK
jgi:rhodanese-related sulfurtransferase